MAFLCCAAVHYLRTFSAASHRCAIARDALCGTPRSTLILHYAPLLLISTSAIGIAAGRCALSAQRVSMRSGSRPSSAWRRNGRKAKIKSTRREEIWRRR